jgi:hypothetical protein
MNCPDCGRSADRCAAIFERTGTRCCADCTGRQPLHGPDTRCDWTAVPLLVAELRKHQAAVQAVEALAEEWSDRLVATHGGRYYAQRLSHALSSALGTEGADDGRGVVCPAECGQHPWLNR